MGTQTHRRGGTLWLTEKLTPYDTYLFGVVDVLLQERTPFQEMWVVRTGTYGRALMLDGKIQSSEHDEFLYHEALVHPAMLLAEEPKRVLVLGGGEGATSRELLRWRGLDSVTMVEIDRRVIEASREYLPSFHAGAFEDPRHEIVVGDAVDYLENTGGWELIVSDISDPVESGPSYRLFTQEMFENMRRALAPGGVLVMQAGSVSPREVHQHARLFRTVRHVFGNAGSYSAHLPTFATPWGFIVAKNADVGHELTMPSAEQIAERMREGMSGSLRAYSPEGLSSVLVRAPYVQAAIDAEDSIYSFDEPLMVTS